MPDIQASMQHACLYLGTPFTCMYMYSMFHMVWTMHVHVLCTGGVLACVLLKLVACLVHVKVHVGVHAHAHVHVHVCACTVVCAHPCASLLGVHVP